jgi:hypothetical protein
MKGAVTVAKHLYVLLQFCKLKGNIVLTFLVPITVSKELVHQTCHTLRLNKLIMHNDFPKQKHLEMLLKNIKDWVKACENSLTKVCF